MKDIKAQVSLEFLLIFSFVLLFLITFTLPLTDLAFNNNLEIENVLHTKNELSKIGKAINQVYYQGEGCKKTVIIDLKESGNINIKNNKISTNFLLNDGDSEKIEIKITPSNLEKYLILSKGINILEINWPLNSDTIEINIK